MGPLLKEIRQNPLLWLLVAVPVVFVAAQFAPEAHTALFILSVLAIVPLAGLLSHATESVAAKTGDAAGGLLNATLGNLTELVIALAALRAGEYTLVKASIAGAIVTNTLFMLGASFLLGGLKYHFQEFNRASARLQSGLLFLATVALLMPSAVAEVDSTSAAAVTEKLSVGLAVLLIVGYALGLLFTLRTHREVFSGAEHGEPGEAQWPILRHQRFRFLLCVPLSGVAGLENAIVDRKLAAILAADVVGYSALMERDEKGTYDRLKAGREQLFEPEIARHHGRVFKLMGDGLLAEFGSVVDAVECAVAVQKEMAKRNDGAGSDERIDLRIGVNLGDVIVEGDDLLWRGCKHRHAP